MREITYSQNGEYQIPDISLEETRGTIGKYGMMRKEYLRNHKVARFNILTLAEPSGQSSDGDRQSGKAESRQPDEQNFWRKIRHRTKWQTGWHGPDT